jgi:hypothetical protein
MVSAMPLVVAVVLLLLVPLVRADDASRRDCRQDCGEALRSCKEDCAPERASGDMEASRRYVDCDADCHGTYTACVDACEPE